MAEDARAALLRVEAALAAREAAAAETFEALRRQARQLHDSGCTEEAQVTPTLVIVWNICLLLLAPMEGLVEAHMPMYVGARCTSTAVRHCAHLYLIPGVPNS